MYMLQKISHFSNLLIFLVLFIFSHFLRTGSFFFSFGIAVLPGANSCGCQMRQSVASLTSCLTSCHRGQMTPEVHQQEVHQGSISNLFIFLSCFYFFWTKKIFVKLCKIFEKKFFAVKLVSNLCIILHKILCRITCVKIFLIKRGISWRKNFWKRHKYLNTLF